MIQLSGAGKRYGHKLLFENADWLITPESRIGLVGANGTGKSTIMKILAGSESLDYGAISRAKGISTGYLPQDGLTLTGRTIFRSEWHRQIHHHENSCRERVARLRRHLARQRHLHRIPSAGRPHLDRPHDFR